ncbi:sugar phosphate isomerase/epimerase family protein [Actinoplanes sp. NPDC051851]|uniref:sugar phosphate isomerase/epimerase family protein n=1 Tax=Actinoplanes sp. NPDC051851 TaxID=3154753 RepID=UPI003417C22F
MRRSIATVSLDGPLEGRLTAAARAGFDAVEIFEPDLLDGPLSPSGVRRLAASLGLGLDLYQPFRDAETTDPDRWRATLRRAGRTFATMAELGADLLLVCSSVAQDAPADDALTAAQLAELADHAAAHGMRIAYEALAWGRRVNDYRHGWRIVDRAAHPALGVCLDSFHVLSRDDDPAAIRDIPGHRLFFVQLADAPRLTLDLLQWSRHHRRLPGRGDFDLTTFLGHVLATGYPGPLSLEIFNDITGRTATEALRSLIALESTLSAR